MHVVDGLSRRSFLVALGALGGLLGLDFSTAWARPILSRRIDDEPLAGAIDLSIRSVARDGLNNFFASPTEVTLLRTRADLREAVFTRAYTMLQPGAFRTEDFSKLDLIEFPKRDYGGRRICSIMEPMDSIAYLALALLAAPAVERNRIAVGEKVVHSYRYRPAPLAGKLFDRRFTYVSFLKEARCRRGASDVMVSCDIANFFGSVTPSVVDVLCPMRLSIQLRHSRSFPCYASGRSKVQLVFLLARMQVRFWLKPFSAAWMHPCKPRA